MMKKLFLLPFALLIMGILFFGCEKENSKLETETAEEEWLSTQRSDCGVDRDECLFICASTHYGMCCCKIEWSYEGSYSPTDPIPTVCVVKDICTNPPCKVECDQTTWNGYLYDFCPAFHDSPPYAPNTVRYTYLCASTYTALSIYNPHPNDDLWVNMDCASAADDSGYSDFM